jgi:hypothetical protein
VAVWIPVSPPSVQADVVRPPESVTLLVRPTVPADACQVTVTPGMGVLSAATCTVSGCGSLVPTTPDWPVVEGSAATVITGG